MKTLCSYDHVACELVCVVEKQRSVKYHNEFYTSSGIGIEKFK